MGNQYRSEASAVVRETAPGLQETSVTDKRTMA